MDAHNNITEAGVKALTYVGGLADRIKKDQEVISYWVDKCREEGASWRMIGVALGVSTQAAWDRFSGHERDSEVPKQEQLPLTDANPDA